MQARDCGRRADESADTNASEFFEQFDGRALYRPSGKVTFEEGIERIAAAMKNAIAAGCSEIVVNTSGLTGFPPPSTFERYEMAVKWANIAGGALCIGFAARPEMIDAEKIGMLMAQNRGVMADVFPTEAEALRWLDARRSTRVNSGPIREAVVC
jgi:hypothetical protein